MPTLEWIGKAKVVNHHLEVPYRVLERQYSYDENGRHDDDNGSENMIIHGDNLEALKSLLPKYEGRVKCIYIDPPYNTGSDGFVYNDNFHFTAEELAEKLSIDDEQAQRILDLTKRGSASHSAWLMFMYPRLLLARDLLTDDGVIFISIDDNEQANCKLICDDVFGEENKIAVIANVNNPKGRSDDEFIATAHEYICIYAKNSERTGWSGFEPTETITKRYNKKTTDGKLFRDIDLRKTGENDLREDRPNLFYYFYYNEETGDFYPSKENEIKDGYIQIKPLREDERDGNWRWELNTALKNIADIYPKYMPVRKIWGVMQKDYLDNRGMVKPVSAWAYKDVNSERGTENFVDLGFDKKVFPKPKPLGTILRCLALASRKDSLIVDFFSGSATSAHAVMAQNIKDNGNRKFVMIQVPELVKANSEAEKEGYSTIDQIGMERIKRAAAKLKAEYPDTTTDLGFKHFTLQETQQETLDKLEDFIPEEQGMFIDNDILSDFGVPTVLTTWLVRDGYGFTAPVQRLAFADYHGYYMDKHLYLLDAEISKDAIAAIADKFETDGSFNPENIVIFGYSFSWTALEELKVNLARLKATEKNLHLNFDVRY